MCLFVRLRLERICATDCGDWGLHTQIHVGQLTPDVLFRTLHIDLQRTPYESGLLLRSLREHTPYFFQAHRSVTELILVRLLCVVCYSTPSTRAQFEDWLCVSLLFDTFSVDVYCETLPTLCTLVLGLQELCVQSDGCQLDTFWTHGALLWRVFTAKRLSILQYSMQAAASAASAVAARQT
jgi:hypothetical protein